MTLAIFVLSMNSTGGQLFTYCTKTKCHQVDRSIHGYMERVPPRQKEYNLKEKQETHAAPRCSAFEAGGGINEMQQQFVSVSHDSDVKRESN